MFQSLTRDSNHSNSDLVNELLLIAEFQSLTRDSNHSNFVRVSGDGTGADGFNPSRGIAIIQTERCAAVRGGSGRFNPSRGIAIIQTRRRRRRAAAQAVSIPHAG